MHYFSTRNKNERFNFAQAALEGLAPSGGLFVPEEIPEYPAHIKSSLGTMDFRDIALETIKPYVHNEIPVSELAAIVNSAFTFNAPLIPVAGHFALELFHGPTAAFKDFGARFMARSFSYLRRGEDRPLHILVATSGDTGGAVADGFFEVPGIFVTVLYPKDRVTPLQERQIAGLGKNVTALAVKGSFDDCQRLVKAALADKDLKKRITLSSANSINISRLIPQVVYYSSAAGRAFAGLVDGDCEATPRVSQRPLRTPKKGLLITLCVPSGNFGNLTAGLYSMKMGAPIERFIAANNINKTVPDYLESGVYVPQISQATISNAMDVGDPSNFERMWAHFRWEQMTKIILGVSVNDAETRETIARVRNEAGYFIDPHTAVGWKGVDKLLAENKITQESSIAVLCTAHPAKFIETVEPLAGKPPVPASLARVMERKIESTVISSEISSLVEILLKQ